MQCELRDHRKALAKTKCTPMWRGIEMLLEPPYSKERLTAFFDNRVTYAVIRHWRYGKSLPPPWTVDLVAGRLRAQGDFLMQVAAAIQVGPGRCHDKEGKHLAKWRAEKSAA